MYIPLWSEPVSSIPSPELAKKKSAPKPLYATPFIKKDRRTFIHTQSPADIQAPSRLIRCTSPFSSNKSAPDLLTSYRQYLASQTETPSQTATQTPNQRSPDFSTTCRHCTASASRCCRRGHHGHICALLADIRTLPSSPPLAPCNKSFINEVDSFLRCRHLLTRISHHTSHRQAVPSGRRGGASKGVGEELYRMSTYHGS